jgi:hypothetical protein
MFLSERVVTTNAAADTAASWPVTTPVMTPKATISEYDGYVSVCDDIWKLYHLNVLKFLRYTTDYDRAYLSDQDIWNPHAARPASS